jgi:hypothetical protein
MGIVVPSGPPQLGGMARNERRHPCCSYTLGMMLRTITTSFDLWSTEQLLLVYQRYYGKLDAQARRRILDTARLNGWDRSWREGVELLAA